MDVPMLPYKPRVLFPKHQSGKLSNTKLDNLLFLCLCSSMLPVELYQRIAPLLEVAFGDEHSNPRVVYGRVLGFIREVVVNNEGDFTLPNRSNQVHFLDHFGVHTVTGFVQAIFLQRFRHLGSGFLLEIRFLNFPVVDLAIFVVIKEEECLLEESLLTLRVSVQNLRASLVSVESEPAALMTQGTGEWRKGRGRKSGGENWRTGSRCWNDESRR